MNTKNYRLCYLFQQGLPRLQALLLIILTGLFFMPAAQAETPPEFVAAWGNEGGMLRNPRGVAVDASGNVYVADSGSHRIQKFASDGTPLAQWLVQSSGEGEFIYPYGIAADANGNIYVAQYNNTLYGDIYAYMPYYFFSIQKYDSSGNFLSEWEVGEDYSPHTFGIAVDATGNVYVANTHNYDNPVQKYDSNGTLLAQWGTFGFGGAEGEFAYPRGITVDAIGNIYVADTDNHRIQKFDNAGNFLSQWGTEGSGEGQFNSPMGIATDAEGNVYVTDYYGNRIQKFTSEGVFLAQWGTAGSGEGALDSPEGIAVDAAGKIYVADSYNNRIQKFDSTGTFLTEWGNPANAVGQFSNNPRITTDANGNLYVADTDNHRILRFDNAGNFLNQWGTEGSGNGQFSSPTGIEVDAAGTLYVADSGNSRIQKFNSAGAYLGQLQLTDPETAQPWLSYLFAIDANGNIYGIDNERILKFDNAGNYLTQWGSHGYENGQFTEIADIAIDSEGNVYVADIWNYRVQKFDSNGAYLMQWGTWGHDAGQFSYQIRLATDADDNVYVADGGNHRIQKFTGNGVFLFEWGAAGSGDGQFIIPRNINTDSEGSVYVYDSGNYRIQKFTYLSPSQPTGLTASAVSSLGINLSWTDASDNETGFIVERCQGTGCGAFAVVGTVAGNTTNYNDNGLTAGTAYSYRVRATNNGSKSAYSNTATATTSLATRPAAPKTLTAVAGSDKQVSLSWSDQSNNQTGFNIERCSGRFCSNFTQIASVSENAVSWSDTTVTSGGSYRYRVRAYNSTGNSAYSNIASITVPAALPAAPSNLAAAALSGSQIQLTWTDNANNETQFKIERCQGSNCSNFVQVRMVSANSTTYRDNRLRSRTTYRYRVRASNNGGNSAYSDVVSATTK
ncbi:MAG: fibronectin type III domain-containing protein [Methylosarcina sp.]